MIKIILGKTNSGKTTLKNELIKKGYIPIIPCTTRPKRDGESNDEYVFYNTNEFFTELYRNHLICYSGYKVINDVWWYGISKFDIDNNNYVVIINPKWYDMFINWCKNNEIEYEIEYLRVSDKEMWERGVKRGDNEEELKRRIEADRKDFEEIEKILLTNEN